MIFSKIKNLFPLRKGNPPAFKTLQTFTYYIPAPPKRKSGYQEKEFDNIFLKLMQKGFELQSINTQGHNGPQSQGMWVICTVRSVHKKNNNFEEEKNIEDEEKNNDISLIKDIYYSKDFTDPIEVFNNNFQNHNRQSVANAKSDDKID